MPIGNIELNENMEFAWFDRQRALDMRQEGMSFPAIARELGIGYGTVVRGMDALFKTQAPNGVTNS